MVALRAVIWQQAVHWVDGRSCGPQTLPRLTRPTLLSLLQIFSQADTSLKRWVLEFAARRKKAEVRNGIIRNDSLWDRLFFNKIQVWGLKSDSKVRELSFLLVATCAP